jgi:D-glycero-D-manno-heptose 1,7-bisphosphate phosphatase
MRTILLDRDGVVNENLTHHVKHWGEFRFLPRSPQAIARLSQAGCRVFIITNQAIVNRGIVAREAVEEINQRMVRELERHGAQITAVAYCPHRPDEGCDCRKPKPGLLLGLAETYGIDLRASVLIGDALADIQAGQAAGCETVLVLTGRGADQLALVRQSTDSHVKVVNDLSDAVDWLLARPLESAPLPHRRSADDAGC